MKIKTADLIGPALDWAVAKCEGKSGVLHDGGITRCIVIASASGVYKGTYQPSINWSQGGALIERENIGLEKHRLDGPYQWAACDWHPVVVQGHTCLERSKFAYGPTQLIAAMRCFVASRLGDEVDVPEGLL